MSERKENKEETPLQTATTLCAARGLAIPQGTTLDELIFFLLYHIWVDDGAAGSRADEKKLPATLQAHYDPLTLSVLAEWAPDLDLLGEDVEEPGGIFAALTGPGSFSWPLRHPHTVLVRYFDHYDQEQLNILRTHEATRAFFQGGVGDLATWSTARLYALALRIESHFVRGVMPTWLHEDLLQYRPAEAKGS